MFEWDEKKAISNLEKHGIDFAEAVSALDDELALTLEDPDAEGERRYVTLGSDAFGRLLTVVYTWRADRIRLISARRATSRERRDYESGP